GLRSLVALGDGERLYPLCRLPCPPDLLRRDPSSHPGFPRGAFLSDPSPDPLAAALPYGPPPAPQERQSWALVRAFDASGGASPLFLRRSHPLDRAVASAARDIPPATPRLCLGPGPFRVRSRRGEGWRRDQDA